MVMDIYATQDMRIDYRNITWEADIQVAHIRNAELPQMVGHIPRTGTFIIQGARKILLSRDSGHLAQMLRNIETHTGCIF